MLRLHRPKTVTAFQSKGRIMSAADLIHKVILFNLNDCKEDTVHPDVPFTQISIYTVNMNVWKLCAFTCLETTHIYIIPYVCNVYFHLQIHLAFLVLGIHTFRFAGRSVADAARRSPGTSGAWSTLLVLWRIVWRATLERNGGNRPLDVDLKAW